MDATVTIKATPQELDMLRHALNTTINWHSTQNKNTANNSAERREHWNKAAQASDLLKKLS